MNMLFSFLSLFLLSFLCIFVSSSQNNSTLTEGLRELLMKPREQAGLMLFRLNTWIMKWGSQCKRALVSNSNLLVLF